MTIEQPGSEFFIAGGTLPPDASSYVKRPTDDELFRHIMAGEFCYVLTPRQMGKSSLMIRTAQRLSNEGVKSAIVDLTQIGTVESEDQWYRGILTQIKRRLSLNIDPVNKWKEGIPSVQNFVDFFEAMLSESKEHFVIFMDEIDTTLQLKFRDNFFAGIRAIFNARAENHNLKRLTFVLLGVASPSDLIKDRNRTPFNIGQEIALRPFSREDARMLEKGLEDAYPKSGKKILDRIIDWTDGHPYLTQKLCQSVVEYRLLDEYHEDEIDGFVERLFISKEASRETNLQFVRDNVLNYPERRVILSLYKKLLRDVEVHENKNSLSQYHLKLSGLARVKDGNLIVSNKIYKKVFDVKWVNKYTEVDWRYVIIGFLVVITLAFSSVYYNDAIRLPNQADSKIVCLTANINKTGIQCLADLFRMKPFVSSNVYEYLAKDTFFNTFSWEEQKSLIEIATGEDRPSTEDYKVVIIGLYTSLADVDGLGETTPLLDLMYDSLKNMGMDNEPVFNEISYWREARASANENNLEDARDKYTAALSDNPQNPNPAILFERARIYVQLGDYKNALNDYEQVIAIVPESNIEPTEINGPTGPSSASEEPSIPTLTSTPTEVQVPVPSLSPTSQLTTASNTPSIPSTPTIEPSTTATPVPSGPSPIRPKFLTLGQRITAVQNDFSRNQTFVVFLSQVNPADYPDLERNGLFVINTTTPLLDVQTLYQAFSSPGDYPAALLDVPNHVITSGRTSFSASNNMHLWVAICSRTTQNCTIKELQLDASGNWNDFIDIGGAGDECTIFDVIFVIVNDATNERFRVNKSSGMVETKFEENKFEARIPFAVRPALDANNQLTSLCPTMSP